MSKKLLILTASILCLFVSGKTYPYKDYDNIVVPYQTGKITIHTPWGIYNRNSYEENYTYTGYVLSQDGQTIYRIDGDKIPKWWVDKYVKYGNDCRSRIQIIYAFNSFNSLSYDKKLSVMNEILRDRPDLFMLNNDLSRDYLYFPIVGAYCN